MIKKLNLFWLGSPLGTPVDINVDITKYFHQIRIFRFNLYYLAKIYVSTVFGKPYLMTYRFLDNALTHCAMLIGSNFVKMDVSHTTSNFCLLICIYLYIIYTCMQGPFLPMVFPPSRVWWDRKRVSSMGSLSMMPRSSWPSSWMVYTRFVSHSRCCSQYFATI